MTVLSEVQTVYVVIAGCVLFLLGIIAVGVWK